MILYCDTSAIIKLYFDEADSKRARQALRAADVLCSHLLAYTEVRAAFAKGLRMQLISPSMLANCKIDFEADWKSLQKIWATQAMCRYAGELAERFGLRAYDSVHLAAAESLFSTLGADAYQFACYDQRLNEAADKLGMQLL